MTCSRLPKPLVANLNRVTSINIKYLAIENLNIEIVVELDLIKKIIQMVAH
jgi:hypothetical protein